jgi:outer membrane protein assembly factor BamE
MPFRPLILTAALIVTLQGCIYRMDVPQGNAVDPDKLARIKPGMTREQVEFLIGQAAIRDPFHAGEDYYIYYLYRGKQRQAEERRMRLRYEGDRLAAIEGSLTADERQE